jgi:hypothetical protein
MDRHGASESDAGRVLGHALGMTFGTYSKPVLERVQETVERIRYEGLKLAATTRGVFLREYRRRTYVKMTVKNK